MSYPLVAAAAFALGQLLTITTAFAGEPSVRGDGGATLAAADFNGDGLPDLAVASPVADTLNVYIRQSSGEFPRTPTHVVPTGATGAKEGAVRHQAIAVGDLNGDAKPDLVVVNSTASVASVLLGRGDGSFLAPIVFPTLPLPSGIALGDFNGDTRPDLAIVSQGTNKVSLLIGSGDGRFNAGGDFVVGFQPTSVVAGDFGTDESTPIRDGILDLAVTATGENNIAVLFGDGSGRFSAPLKVSAVGASAIAAADFNRDGTLDLATSNTGEHFVGINIGYGQGNFGAFANETEEFNFGDAVRPIGLVVADFDGDGNLDLAVTGQSVHANQNGVFVLLSRPRPRMRIVYFDPPVFCATAGPPAAIVIENTKGVRGGVDVAIADTGSDRVWRLFGDGKGGFVNCTAAQQLADGLAQSPSSGESAR